MRGAMKSFLLKLFTWWNSQTFGTQLWTWLYGEAVGEDEFGNRYYRTAAARSIRTSAFERRWVIYNGYAEASTVPPSWHGWLHHTVDMPPTQESYKPRPWQKPHRANMTGTPARLPADRLDAGRRPPPEGDRRLQGLDAGRLDGRAASGRLARINTGVVFQDIPSFGRGFFPIPKPVAGIFVRVGARDVGK